MSNVMQIELPASNTGVQNTSPQLDWLSFTVTNTKDNQAWWREMFSAYTIIEHDFGGLGYAYSATILNGGRVYWHPGRLDMGIHVRLNSKSLSLLDYTPVGLMNVLVRRLAKVTRMDVAFDDVNGLLDIDEMYRKVLQGDVVTRWRIVKRVSVSNMGSGEENGSTVNVGSRASEAFLRIYDKKLERQAKGFDVSNIDTWIRVELELKGDKADAFYRILAKTATDLEQGTCAMACYELLYGMIDFKDRSEYDTNKSRWATSDFWLKFVKGSGKKFLSLPPKSKGVEQTKRWVERNVGPSLAMIVLCKDDDDGRSGWDFIAEVIIDGQERMSKSQQTMLELHNQADTA